MIDSKLSQRSSYVLNCNIQLLELFDLKHDDCTHDDDDEEEGVDSSRDQYSGPLICEENRHY